MLERFGNNVAIAFEEKVKDFLSILGEFPEIGQVVHIPTGIRGFQLTKQTKLLYRIKKEEIILLSFFDVRQDPGKEL